MSVSGLASTVSPRRGFIATGDRLLAAQTYLLSLEKTVKRGSALQNFLKDLRLSHLFLQNISLGAHASGEGHTGGMPYAAVLDEAKKTPNQDAMGIFDSGKTLVITDGYQEEGHWCSLAMQKVIADHPALSPKRWMEEATKLMRDLAIGPFSGACFVSLRMTPKGTHVAWLGDSKCFQIRGKVIVFETEEHTVAEDAIREGRATAVSLWNSHDHHVVSKSVHPLGDDAPAEAELNLEREDWIVLCSDGVSDNLKTLRKGKESYDRVLSVLQIAKTPREARDLLLREVQQHIAREVRGDEELANSKRDNISLVVIRIA